jgi:hypothetical protein
MGEWDVDAMLDEMSCPVFDEWMAYYTVAPWGPERDALHMGIIASATVAPHCKKHQVPKPKDFMPDFIEPQKPMQNITHMKSQFQAFANAAKNKKRGN